MLGICKRKNLFNKCYDFSKTKVDEQGVSLIDKIVGGKYYVSIDGVDFKVPENAIILKTNDKKSDNYFMKCENFLDMYSCPDSSEEDEERGFLGLCERKYDSTWCYDFDNTMLDESLNPLFHATNKNKEHFIYPDTPQITAEDFDSQITYDNDMTFSHTFMLKRKFDKNLKLIKIPKNWIIAKNTAGEKTTLYMMPRRIFDEIYE